MKESRIMYPINGSSPSPYYFGGNSRPDTSLFMIPFPNIMAEAVEQERP